MPIQPFSFPIPETRFFHVGQHVYKFKIRRGSKISDEEMLDSEFVNEELENAVRVVLMSLDNLHPFTTQHFIIFPYKSRWERVSELRFRKGDKKLFAYPFLITLFVETNEIIPSHTVNSANKWVPSGSTFPPSGGNLCYAFEDRDCRLGIPPCSTFCAHPSANEPECKKTEEPQEGHLSLDHHDKEDRHQCLQELPNLSGGAEETFCSSEDSESADLEESSSSAPERHVVEQDSKCENPGILARLASMTAFPFSLLFKRS